MFEFDTSVLGCELLVCLGVIGISVVFPSCDFVDEGVFVGDGAVETLSGEDTEFGFRQIEPAAVLGACKHCDASLIEQDRSFKKPRLNG